MGFGNRVLYATKCHETFKAINDLFRESQNYHRYSFLSVLATECLQMTTRYLRFTGMKGVTNATSPFYVLPFSYQQVVAKPASSAGEYFCKRFTKSQLEKQ